MEAMMFHSYVSCQRVLGAAVVLKNLGSDGFLNGKRMERGQPFEDDMDILGGGQLWLENSLNQWPFQDP